MTAGRAVPPQRVEAFRVVANATHASTVTVRCDADLERQYREGVADAGGDLDRVIFRRRGRRAAP